MRVRIAAAMSAGTVAAIIWCAGCSASPQPDGTPSRSLPSPGCSTATAGSPRLGRVRTAMVTVSGTPFGVAVTPDGRWAFAALVGAVEVLRLGGSLAPVKVRAIAMPAASPVLGVTLTRDGRYLLGASGSGAVVISVARAAQGQAGAVLGTLADPSGGRGRGRGGRLPRRRVPVR